MRAQEIISRGVQELKNEDLSFSQTGKPDFAPSTPPEIRIFNPRGTPPIPRGPSKPLEFKKLEPRPRTKVSENNSYT